MDDASRRGARPRTVHRGQHAGCAALEEPAPRECRDPDLRIMCGAHSRRHRRRGARRRCREVPASSHAGLESRWRQLAVRRRSCGTSDQPGEGVTRGVVTGRARAPEGLIYGGRCRGRAGRGVAQPRRGVGRRLGDPAARVRRCAARATRGRESSVDVGLSSSRTRAVRRPAPGHRRCSGRRSGGALGSWRRRRVHAHRRRRRHGQCRWWRPGLGGRWWHTRGRRPPPDRPARGGRRQHVAAGAATPLRRARRRLARW